MTDVTFKVTQQESAHQKVDVCVVVYGVESWSMKGNVSITGYHVFEYGQKKKLTEIRGVTVTCSRHA